MSKSGSRNNADFPKIHNIFRINCFVLAIALVREIVQSLAKIQITAELVAKGNANRWIVLVAV